MSDQTSSEGETKAGIQPNPSTSFEPPAEADWHRMISETAYLLAEKRNFQEGHELEDWLQAEDEVKRLISA